MRIMIWGTGELARTITVNSEQNEIVGYIESVVSAREFMAREVYSPEETLALQYDYIIVSSTYASQIKQTCIKTGIDVNKVIFMKAVKAQQGYADLEGLRKVLGEKNYTLYCSEYGITEHSFVDDDAKKYSEMNKRPQFDIQERYNWKIIGDKYASAGTISNYFWQDLWAARLIAKSGKKIHYDIGSRLDGFIAHLLSMGIQVTMIDVRPFPGEIEGLSTIVDDATMLSQFDDDSIDSLSALCSLEHFGLGRYGDEIDPEGCFKCFDSIQKKMKKGGDLYISVPIGKERLEFNAHRVFYAKTIIDCFDQMEMIRYSCVAENTLEENVKIDKYDQDPHNGNYRYGLFWFKKRG